MKSADRKFCLLFCFSWYSFARLLIRVFPIISCSLRLSRSRLYSSFSFCKRLCCGCSCSALSQFTTATLSPLPILPQAESISARAVKTIKSQRIMFPPSAMENEAPAEPHLMRYHFFGFCNALATSSVISVPPYTTVALSTTTFRPFLSAIFLMVSLISFSKGSIRSFSLLARRS